MPILSSLGALTYSKVFLGEQWYWYIETTPGNATQFTNFALNGENIYVAGNVTSSANTSVYDPQSLIINNSNLTLPTDDYHAFYASGSTRSGTHNDVKHDGANLYFTGPQSVVVNTISQPSGVIRILNSDGTLQNTYVDLPTASTRTRIPRNIALHGNGTYTVVGQSQETTSTQIGYITNFTGNTKNWAKTFGNSTVAKMKLSPSNTFVVTSVSGTQDTILEISSNGNSILKQYTVAPNTLKDITVDSSNNIYYTIGNSTITTIAKVDSSNTIVWQKQMSANVQSNSAIQIYSMDYAEGNVYVAGQANAPGGNLSNGLPLAIMSFDSNTGNLNWQTRFYESGINFLTTDPSIKYDNGNLYISSTQVTGTDYGYMIKIPASGAIPGNGTYSNNLKYETSNVTISNANLSITAGNLTLINAVNTAVVTSNITANTANVWTFNSTRLT